MVYTALTTGSNENIPIHIHTIYKLCQTRHHSVLVYVAIDLTYLGVTIKTWRAQRPLITGICVCQIKCMFLKSPVAT